MKYKNLKSAAHNFADSFASSLNYDSDDYVMSHLCRSVIAFGRKELNVDLLSGVATPPELLTPPVIQSLALRTQRFPEQLRSQRIDPERVQRATMRFVFEDARVGEDIGFPNHKEMPFDAFVTLLDDRGVEHTAHFRRWWSFRSGRTEFSHPSLRQRLEWLIRRLLRGRW